MYINTSRNHKWCVHSSPTYHQKEKTRSHQNIHVNANKVQYIAGEWGAGGQFSPLFSRKNKYLFSSQPSSIVPDRIFCDTHVHAKCACCYFCPPISEILPAPLHNIWKNVHVNITKQKLYILCTNNVIEVFCQLRSSFLNCSEQLQTHTQDLVVDCSSACDCDL